MLQPLIRDLDDELIRIELQVALFSSAVPAHAGPDLRGFKNKLSVVLLCE